MRSDPVQITEEMVFKLSRKRSPSEVDLRSFEWAIVTQLNGEKSVKQIGDTLALEPRETIAMFKRLFDEGLLELVHIPESDPFIPSELFAEIEYEFTYFVGPIAAILLEDQLAEFKRSRENLDRRQFPLLIELLSLEITNTEKKHEFQKRMLKKIKGLF